MVDVTISSSQSSSSTSSYRSFKPNNNIAKCSSFSLLDDDEEEVEVEIGSGVNTISSYYTAPPAPKTSRASSCRQILLRLLYFYASIYYTILLQY